MEATAEEAESPHKNQTWELMNFQEKRGNMVQVDI